MVSRKIVLGLALSSALAGISSTASAQLVDLTGVLGGTPALDLTGVLSDVSGLLSNGGVLSGTLEQGLTQGDGSLVGNTDNATSDNRNGSNAVDGGGGAGQGGAGGVALSNGGGGGNGGAGGGNNSNNNNDNNNDNRVNNRNQHNNPDPNANL